MKKMFSKAKFLVLGAVGSMTAVAMAVTASASGSATEDAIKAAGTELAFEFTSMVAAVIPLIITVAVTGLGVYGVIMLFGFAKKLFAKATG